MFMTCAPAGADASATAIAAATSRLVRFAVAATALGVLAACGGVKIKPEAALPKPIIETIDAKVGLVIPGDARNYVHKETRWGVGWEIALGEGHTRLMRDMFKDEFREVEEFKDIDAARGASDLKALFEPRIEQYSFVTARETGGRYYAVTIRYRINLYTPQGEKADSYTLTGYGNALAKGMSSGAPLARASAAAMRDAAAKFLVQFVEQPAGQQLAHNEAITAEKAAATADNGQIEAVPIEESAPETAALPATQPPSPAPTASPAPSGPTPDIAHDSAHDAVPVPQT
jgi:hypothetical protein